MNNTQVMYDSPEYKRSRTAYKWECTFEYFIAILVGDAFLAKLLTDIGFSEAETGVISSLITLAFLFQLVSVFVVRKITNTKIFAILFHTTSQIFFMSLYVVPFLPFVAPFKKPLVVICILLAYFGNYMVSTVIFRWGNSYVDPKKRAGFTAGKEIISLITGMIVSFGAGYIMQRFEEAGNLTKGELHGNKESKRPRPGSGRPSGRRCPQDRDHRNPDPSHLTGGDLFRPAPQVL